MGHEHLHLALYRGLCRGYPRTFRDVYGEDLSATFALQLRELGAARCWLRTLRDLTVTVPSLHMEQHMHQPNPTHVIAGCLAVAVGGTMAALVTGTSVYGIAFLLVAAAALAAATMSRRASKSAIALARSSAWWKFLGAGAVLLAAIVVLINQPGAENQELSSAAWSLMMVSLLASFTLIGAGIVLGSARFLRRRHG